MASRIINAIYVIVVMAASYRMSVLLMLALEDILYIEFESDFLNKRCTLTSGFSKALILENIVGIIISILIGLFVFFFLPLESFL